jgi:kelch-like protein 20
MQLDPSNCLGIREFADTHSCVELMQISEKYLLYNYIDVTESDEFLLLTPKQLIHIISNDDLNVRNEEQVYKSVMKWIKSNINERKHVMAELMTHVRLPLLDIKYLVTKVSNDPLIKQDQMCRDLIDEAKDWHLLPNERTANQTLRTRPRKPYVTGEVLFAVGGWCSGDAISSVEMYDPSAAVAAASGSISISPHGSNDPHDWKIVTSMNKRRCGVGVAVLNSQLYAIGGHGNFFILVN